MDIETGRGRIGLNEGDTLHLHPTSMPFWRFWMGDEKVDFVVLRQSQALKMGSARTDQIENLFSGSGIFVEVTLGNSEQFYTIVSYSEWRAKYYSYR